MILDSKKRTVAIDSGRDMGWALGHDQKLVACGLGLASLLQTLQGQEQEVEQIVIERPHTAQLRATKKDIITLAIRAGEVGGLLRYLTKKEPKYIEPSTWKGSITKDISHERTLTKLTKSERTVYNAPKVAKNKRHNVLDAIGILFYCSMR
jgi:hypothetical protein